MTCNCHSQKYPTDSNPRLFQQPQIQPSFPTLPLPPFQPGTIPTPPTGFPSQLTQANLSTILGQYQRPTGQPPGEMVFLYNLLKSNPSMLQTFIQQPPQSLQHAVQLAQFGSGAPRPSQERVLPGYCYFRWSLVFTFTDVFLMWPVTNLFGFVIGYCYPFLTPCIIPDFQILFALC